MIAFSNRPYAFGGDIDVEDSLDKLVVGLGDCPSPYDEDTVDRLIRREQEKEERRKFEEKRNIKRDKHGKLNKGALLALKDCCDKDKIWQLHCSGKTVKRIVEIMGCSKSTVYNVLKMHKGTTE